MNRAAAVLRVERLVLVHVGKAGAEVATHSGATCVGRGGTSGTGRGLACQHATGARAAVIPLASDTLVAVLARAFSVRDCAVVSTHDTIRPTCLVRLARTIVAIAAE